MDTDHWHQLSPVLDQLLDMTGLQRAHQLRLIRQSQASLADEISALLALEENMDSIWPPPLYKTPNMPHPGTRVGPYCLEGLLGEGGMSMVWSATHVYSKRRVALKLTHADLPDHQARLHLIRERDVLARLQHPYIVRMLDADIDTTGTPYLALEYIEGTAITQYCRQHAATLSARLDLFKQICQAVIYAHVHSVVHGDLKPSNILVTTDGQTRLIDFGIARRLDLHNRQIASAEPHAFTSHYAAPEQIRGDPATVRSDIFSLGAILFELLTDRKLSHQPVAPLLAWEHAVAAQDVLCADLDHVMHQALAECADHRYPTVEAFSTDVQQHLSAFATHAKPQHLDINYIRVPLHQPQ